MIEQVHSHFIQLLKQMDEEATSSFMEKGHSWPSGLRQYHGHYRHAFGGKDGCEVAWARRLASLLREKGIEASVNEPYPLYALPSGKKRQWVDLRISLPDQSYFWLEIKGSWPVCFRDGRKNFSLCVQ